MSYAGHRPVEVFGILQPTIEVNVRRTESEWPHGRITVAGKVMTPNQARRLVMALEKAISAAEAKG